MDDISVIEGDLGNASVQRDFLAMMDAYVLDPMEGGQPLAAAVRRELVPELRKHPAHFVFLAYHREAAIGFSTCILGFSSFAARPLINVHDIGVLAEYRGCGVGRALLSAIEAKARSLGCCKLTLEVRVDNVPARNLYRKFGFEQSTIGTVAQEFWDKSL